MKKSTVQLPIVIAILVILMVCGIVRFVGDLGSDASKPEWEPASKYAATYQSGAYDVVV